MREAPLRLFWVFVSFKDGDVVSIKDAEHSGGGIFVKVPALVAETVNFDAEAGPDEQIGDFE